MAVKTEVDKAKFEALCTEGLQMSDVACLCGVTCTQLRRWCKKTYNDTLEHAIEHFSANLRQKIQKLFLSNLVDEHGLKERAAIFAMKNVCGWKDNPDGAMNVPQDEHEFGATKQVQETNSLLNALGVRTVVGVDDEEEEDAMEQ